MDYKAQNTRPVALNDIVNITIQQKEVLTEEKALPVALAFEYRPVACQGEVLSM